MNRSTLGRLARTLSLVVSTGLASAAVQAQEVKLKFHHMWNTQAMAPNHVIKPWCEKIAAESKGRMVCELYPSMQLGGTPPQLVDQVRDGVVDIVFTVPGYTPGRFPMIEVFELPFMTNSAEAGARALWDFYSKHGQKEFAGMKPLLFTVHDEGYLHTRDRQVKSLADFKGLKIRAGTRTVSKMVTALGATPVQMPLPSVPESIGKGVIDGFLLPWEVFPALKLHEMVKFHTETDPARGALYATILMMVMNPAKYNGLPADLKAVIDANSGASLSAFAGKAWDSSQAGNRKPAVDRGNTFYTVPASELDLWAKASASVADEWVASMDKAGLPGKAMLDEARALLVKYRK